MANSLADEFQIKLAALGGVGASIADKERAFYASVSGLPVTSSISDHKRAWYQIQLVSVTPTKSFIDIEESFWTFINAANNKGSWNDRAYSYYGS